MDEYTCKKCGQLCEVMFEDLKGNGNGWDQATIWCDTCNDYAQGSLEIVGELERDHYADKTDAIYERMKDQQTYELWKEHNR